MTILLIEDDPDVQMFILSHLDRTPQVVLDAVNTGSEALGKSVVGSYDLVFLDLHLPDIGGLDILPVLRANQSRSVIAVISGYANLVTEDDFEIADVVISKPFDMPVIDKLVSMAKEISDLRTGIRELGIACDG